MTKRSLLTAALAAVLTFGTAFAATAPETVIHVVTIKWKDGTTDAQIKEAIGGVQAAAKLYPGIKRIWLRSIKVQGQDFGGTHAVVMEFENEESLKKYANSPAQKAFYEVYTKYRDQSRTHDITN